MSTFITPPRPMMLPAAIIFQLLSLAPLRLQLRQQSPLLLTDQGNLGLQGGRLWLHAQKFFCGWSFFLHSHSQLGLGIRWLNDKVITQVKFAANFALHFQLATVCWVQSSCFLPSLSEMFFSSFSQDAVCPPNEACKFSICRSRGRVAEVTLWLSSWFLVSASWSLCQCVSDHHREMPRVKEIPMGVKLFSFLGHGEWVWQDISSDEYITWCSSLISSLK